MGHSDDRKERLLQIVNALPETPGVYQYIDKTGKIIYVGKAKNLRRRVSSYFHKTHEIVKLNLLVRNIADIRYVVLNSEEDALHLENSLIKQHQPRYNSMLKDDKSYPWICVSNESFPRVFQTRNYVKNGSIYFGPYSNVGMVKVLLSLFSELYPLRTCRLDLSPPAIREKGYKVCLQYHIKRCEGCCAGYVSSEQYALYIDQIKQILKGDLDLLIDYLTAEMTRHAESLRFEAAQHIKEQLDRLSTYQAKSVIVNPIYNRLSICSIVRDETTAFFNYLEVSKGSIVKGLTLEFSNLQEDDSDAQLLARGLTDIIDKFGTIQHEVVVPLLPDPELSGYTFVVPQRGDKLKLLDLSLKNARQCQVDRYKQREKINPEMRGERLLNVLKKDLNLSVLPKHIECFDNSNLQGTNPVAACVVFKNAKPSKRDYRHFNIKTVEGPNDFASMQEILTRRYSRLLAENAELPDLIVVDGGKGQLHVAYDVLVSLGLQTRIPIIGIAKRLEEIFFPNDPLPIYLNKTSESLKVIQHLRDEAHRFGITFHRNKRSKTQIISELDGISGIGEQMKKSLLVHFRTIKRIKEASLSELQELIGKSKGTIVFKSLHQFVNE